MQWVCLFIQAERTYVWKLFNFLINIPSNKLGQTKNKKKDALGKPQKNYLPLSEKELFWDFLLKNFRRPLCSRGEGKALMALAFFLRLPLLHIMNSSNFAICTAVFLFSCMIYIDKISARKVRLLLHIISKNFILKHNTFDNNISQ